MINRLKKLISFQSYSGHETPLLEYIKTEIEKSGIKPFFQGDNLVLKLEGKDSTRAFIFNGHVDVVDIGVVKKWKYDPWAGEVIGGKIYGRGSSDMKGGVLAIMETAKTLVKKGTPPTDVWFTFVVREETDGGGSRQFTKWFQKERYLQKYHELAALFAEPTGLETVHHGHRGNFFIRAKIDGVSGHASRPDDISPHAIIEMSKFVTAINGQRLKWKKEFMDSEFDPPSITVTSIDGRSESPNRTADSCVAHFDLRTIPGYHREAFEKIKQLAKEYDVKISLLHPPSPSGYTSKDAKIVRVFKKFDPKITITPANVSTDQGFFSEIGIDSVIFGPGDMSQAHATDESADINQITRTPGIFLDVYRAWTASE